MRVDAEAVEQARRAGGEHLAARERRAVGVTVEGADVAGGPATCVRAGVGDVEQLSSGEKARPLGCTKSVATARDGAARRIDAVDVATRRSRSAPASPS